MENYPKIFGLAKYINYCYALAIEKAPDCIVIDASYPTTACLNGIKRHDFVEGYNFLNGALKTNVRLKEKYPRLEDSIDSLSQEFAMLRDGIEIVLANEFGAAKSASISSSSEFGEEE